MSTYAKLNAIGAALLSMLLLAAFFSMPVEAKSRKHIDHSGEDTIKAGQTVKDGIVCKTQKIIVTGKARPTLPWDMAKGNAEELWKSTVVGIHGERFSGLDLAREVEKIKLPARLKQSRYVIKGIPCAVSL